MANNNFDFPGVTLQQVFEGSVVGSVGKLSAVCVGEQYKLHRADSADAASLIPQTDTNRYITGTEFRLQAIPGISKYGKVDTDTSTQHLVAKNAVFTYASKVGITLEGSDPDNDSSNAVLFDGIVLADGSGKYADAMFGNRGVKVGDPAVLTYTPENGTETTIETYIVGIQATSENTGYDTLVFDYATLPAGVDNIVVNFGVYADASFEAADGAVTIIQGTTSQEVIIAATLQTELQEVGLSGTLYSCDALYLEYRERTQEYVGKVGYVADPEEVANVLGEVHPENPLAMAVYAAVKASNGVFVYFTAVAPESTSDAHMVDAYNSAFGFLENYTNIYSVIPVTNNASVIAAALKSAEATEGEESKIRRTVWYGVDSPTEVITVSISSTFTAGSITDGKQTLVFPRSVFANVGFKEGDVLNIGNAEYPIEALRTQSVTVANTTGIAIAAADTAVAVRIIRKSPNADDITDAIVASKISSSYRAQCVWSEGGYINGYKVPNYVLAAAAAGMRSYEEVQRPLSNLGYSFITIEETAGLTKTQLIRMGSNGIWIIGNNDDGLAINRKQVTTAASGNLNKDEESIVANADEIALSVANLGKDKVGCSNISSDMITVLRLDLSSVMNSKTKNATSVYVGPQLIDWELVRMWQDEVHADWIWAEFTCEPPKPFNKFKMVMRVI